MSLKLFWNADSENINAISLGARVEERYPSLCEKSTSPEMVSGKKVKNVRHPTDAILENIT